MQLKRRTVNLINPKRRGTRTSTRYVEQLRLYPGAHAVTAISAGNGCSVEFADVAGTRPGVGTVTTTLDHGPKITRRTVSLSALRDALSSIGFSFPEDVEPGGVLQLSISGSIEQNADSGALSLIVSSGICEIVEPSMCGELMTEKKPASRFSSTSPKREN